MSFQEIFRTARTFSLLVLLGVGIFSIGFRAQAFSGAGDGLAAETAFIITTCDQLQEMNDDLDAYYKLGNAIDCAGTTSWNINLDEFESGDSDEPLIPDPYTGVINNGYFGFEPIGQDDVLNNAGSGFTGTLDGQGYTISDLWIFRKGTDYNGVIGYATNATIKNITLNNPRIVGRSHTGGILGYGSGVTLENLTNTSGMVRAYLAYYGGGIAGYLISTSIATALTVTDGTVHGSGNVIGGLVGYLHTSSVTNSTTSANVDGGEYIGGAFGEVYDAQIDNVDATGSVDSNDADDAYIAFFSKDSRYAGGFAGSISDSTVQNSTATGIVTSEGDYTGGFAGRIYTSNIFDSSATGAVSGNESVGGFGGVISDSEITDSSATGIVQSVGGNVGGFAGQTYCGSLFLRVSASGNVTAGNGNAGGFTGFDGCEGPGSTFNQVSAHGNVTGNNVIGGFVGESYVSTFINVYSGGSVTGNDQVGSFAGTLASGNVTNAYARGLITLTAPGTLVGGFANNATDTVFTNSFWDGEAIGREEACNTGECSGLTELTTAQATTQSTYTDATWDFDTIWAQGTDNDGYPFFGWEPFESSGDSTAPVITVVQSIPSQVVLANAEIRFTTSESCTILAEQPLSSLGDVELTFTESSVGMTIIGRLTGMRVGGTYSYAFVCRDEANNTSSLVEVGPFTIIETPIVTSSGGGSQFAWKPTGSSSAVAPSNDDNNTCSADQILTQNMRAGARNGKFHPYTKAIVKEVKILQAHMNRLGFNSGPEDGILGKLTDGAIKRMQVYLGTKADGLVGPITRALINKSCGDAGLQKTL
jgi:hypothetical protein